MTFFLNSLSAHKSIEKYQIMLTLSNLNLINLDTHKKSIYETMNRIKPDLTDIRTVEYIDKFQRT